MTTASGIERELACPASAALPGAHGQSEDAARGHVLHAFLKRTRVMPIDRALASVSKENREVCSKINLQHVYGGLRNVRTEVAYALHVGHEEATLLGFDLERRYPRLPADYICGTNDFEGVRFDDVEVVGDVKTGNDVTACARNPQMMFHARVRQLITGADEVEARIVYIRPTGRVVTDWHVFTRLELDRFEDRLAESLERVREARALVFAGGVPNVSTGDHCRYCPSVSSCPAQVTLARAMLPELVDANAMLVALTPQQAGDVWRKLEKVYELADRIHEGLRTIATHTRLPLGDGREVRELVMDKGSFSKERAIALLKRKGATVAEIESCTVDRVERQVRALKVKAS